MSDDDADAISVDPETETLRAACCEWTLETRWADTPLHRRILGNAIRQHRNTLSHEARARVGSDDE